MVCFEPTLFESPELETASEAALFVKEYLAERGYENLADGLEGLVPVTNTAMGRIVLRVLSDIHLIVRDTQTREYIQHAISSLENAVFSQAFSAAS